MKARLYLVRHGETAWNREGRWQGWIDIPLNECGKRQAQDLAVQLSSQPIQAIYTSPLLRAAETAQFIAEHHDCSLIHDPDLKEQTGGSLDGSLIEELNLILKEAEKLPTQKRVAHKLAPDAESGIEVGARVIPALKRIAQNHLNEDVVVVTHGGVLRILLVLLAGRDYHSIKIGNCEVFQLEGTHDELQFTDIEQGCMSIADGSNAKPPSRQKQ